MSDSSIIGQLYQRKMFRIGAGYLAVAWLLWQVVANTCPTFECSNEFSRTIFWLLLGGLPVTLAVAWVNWKTAIIVGVAFIAGVGVTVMMMGSQPLTEIPTPLPVAEEAVQERLPNSVAVLPFENLSLNSEDAFFAAGIHDTILKELAKIRDMNVISRTAMLRYIDNPTPIPQVAEELNVQTVMEGSVQYANERVLVTVQLIDPETDTHIWAESYNESFSDIFAIQADIAIKIANALEAELSLAEQQNIEREPTNSPEAWEFYLKARALVPNIGSTNVPPEFHQYLDRAIELDPNFALAMAVKASDYSFAMRRPEMTIYEPLSLPDREALAIGYAQKALDIDPNLGEAHMAMGFLHRWSWRGEEAIASFRRAAELSPNNEDVLDDYARILAEAGYREEALKVVRRARELGGSDNLMVTVLLRSGRFAEALEVARLTYSEDPYLNMANFTAALELLTGNEAEAQRYLEAAEGLVEDKAEDAGGLLMTAYLYGRLNDTENAQRIFDEVEMIADDVRITPVNWAYGYLGIGDERIALEWLRKSAENRLPYNSSTRQSDFSQNTYRDPILDKPEFVAVREKMGFRTNVSL